MTDRVPIGDVEASQLVTDNTYAARALLDMLRSIADSDQEPDDGPVGVG